MPGSNGVKITGLRELDRALGKYDPTFVKDSGPN
jgi:hypothetical protein